MTITIEPFNPATFDGTNDERAEMIRPFVEGYMRAHYHHPAGELLETVIGDMIANMGHLCDRLDESERDTERPGGPRTTTEIIEMGVGHWAYEVAEEAADPDHDDEPNPHVHVAVDV